MGTIIIIMRQQFRYLIKSPVTLMILIFAPVFLIFIMGQSMYALFESDPGMPGAMDYLGITILTMGVMLGGFIPAWLILNDGKYKTAIRLEISPVSMTNVYIGKFASSFLILVLLSMIIMLICGLVLSINYGTDIVLLFLPVASLAFFSTSLGSLVAVTFRNEKAANGLLNTFFPLLIFLGGGYFKLPDEGFLKDISIISPVRWANLALTDLANSGANEKIGPAILVSVVPGIVFVLLAVLRVNRGRKI